ncbi:hypothetical protein BC834DRAFT_143880 [Gloeopeniophorella convolvens]|nr:hypothetical protein BC834DRAFT_143880 [Gloeopeniophorella convolvens]
MEGDACTMLASTDRPRVGIIHSARVEDIFWDGYSIADSLSYGTTVAFPIGMASTSAQRKFVCTRHSPLTGPVLHAGRSPIILSYKMSTPDSCDQAVFLLQRVSKQLSGGPGVQLEAYPPFSPGAWIICVNAMWTMRLVLSIACALAATLTQRYQRVGIGMQRQRIRNCESRRTLVIVDYARGCPTTFRIRENPSLACLLPPPSPAAPPPTYSVRSGLT